MEKLDYNAGGFIPSTLPGWTDTIDNIPRIPASEIIYRPELLENGKAGRIRPEQKSTALLKTLVAKYCPPGGLVLDPFAGTMSTARACLLLDSHRRCVCTDVDEECVKVSIPSLLDVFASQLLNEDSDITGSEEVLRAARDYTHRRDSIRSRTVRNAWSTPPGMHGMQTFPKDVLEYISGRFEDPKVSVAYRNIPYTSWGATWKVRFNELDPKELIAHQLALNKLYITESTIPNAGKGLFTREAIGPNTFIGYYFGSLHYDNLGVGKTNSHEWHGEGMMAFPLNEFTKWAFKVTQKVPVPSRQQQSISTVQETVQCWIHPAPFCTMRFINDARVVATERTGRLMSTNIGMQTPRQNNCEFRDAFKTKKTGTSKDIQSFEAVSVVTTKQVNANEELFASYGERYIF